MKKIKFAVNGGMITVSGKPEWPVHLHVTMDKEEAWQIASSILWQLQHNTPTVNIDLLGDDEGAE